jgi:hypothetical protein
MEQSAAMPEVEEHDGLTINAMDRQQLNRSELSNQQIIDLLWPVKGTPEAQPNNKRSTFDF